VVVNRPPVAGTDTLARTLTHGAKISISTLLANDSDADGDPVHFVSVSATSTNGGTVTTNGGWVFYQPASLGDTNQDGFSYIINDGRGGNATGWVVMLPPEDTAPSPNLLITLGTNGAIMLRFDGIPGLTYRIQYTTNLVSALWFELGSETANSVGLFQYLDAPPPGTTNRFYRSAYP
jgi:hypothetical protein